MSWHRHVCREAGAISWLISAFRITIFSAAPCHFGCFLPRSPSFCAFAALMCRTWGFYRVLNIAPQGSHNQDSISNYAMESREREREREMQGCEARWHWTISALNPFVFHFPYLQKKKKTLKPIERLTQTRLRAANKEHCVLQTLWYLSSPQAKPFRFSYGGRAASISGAAGLKGIDGYTTFGHICNLVGCDGAIPEHLPFRKWSSQNWSGFPLESRQFAPINSNN